MTFTKDGQVAKIILSCLKVPLEQVESMIVMILSIPFEFVMLSSGKEEQPKVEIEISKSGITVLGTIERFSGQVTTLSLQKEKVVIEIEGIEVRFNQPLTMEIKRSSSKK